jgi:hypothetical protein
MPNMFRTSLIHQEEHVEEELNDSDSDQSESCGGSSSGKGSNHDSGATEPDSTIAKQETKDVFRLKMVVSFVLIVAAIGVAAAVYVYLRHSEEHQFLQQFKEDATKVLDTLEGVVDQTMAALDGVAVNMVSTAKMTNQTWPFVTIDDFAVRMSKVVPLARALCISYYQVIAPEKRDQWEEYALSHNYWVNETMTVQRDWGGYYDSTEYNGYQNPSIYGDYEDIPRNER